MCNWCYNYTKCGGVLNSSLLKQKHNTKLLSFRFLGRVNRNDCSVGLGNVLKYVMQKYR